MAVSGSAEFDVDASPEQVMDAVAAVKDLPQRSPSHKSAVVESRHADGRPNRVRAQVSAAGFSDEEVTDYTWDEPRSLTWTLVESSMQSEQVGTYTLTPTDGGTHIRLDLEIGVKVPMPGFVLKRILQGALDIGSKGFKKYVEGSQNGPKNGSVRVSGAASPTWLNTQNRTISPPQMVMSLRKC